MTGMTFLQEMLVLILPLDISHVPQVGNHWFRLTKQDDFFDPI